MNSQSNENNLNGPTKKDILRVLSEVQDPDLNRDLVSLGMIQNLSIEGGTVSFTLQLTTPACPMKAEIEKNCREALSKVDGVTDVNIEISSKTAQRPRIPEKEEIPGIKNIIAVSSGKGGVGKSTVSVNIAIALQKTGAKVGLLDADAYGPNIPQMIGLKELPRADNQERLYPPEIHGVKVMSIASLVQKDTPIVWRGPMLHNLMIQFLQYVQWGELDYLVVDMPPGTGDTQLSLTQLVPLAGVIMVTTPQKVAQADVRRAIMMFKKMDAPILGIIENMSYFICPDNNKKYEIFGSGGGEKLAEEYDITLLGQLPIDTRISRGGDKGKPVVVTDPDSPVAQEFIKAAGAAAQQISIANLK